MLRVVRGADRRSWAILAGRFPSSRAQKRGVEDLEQLEAARLLSAPRGSQIRFQDDVLQQRLALPVGERHHVVAHGHQHAAREFLWILAARIDAKFKLGFAGSLTPHKLRPAELRRAAI